MASKLYPALRDKALEVHHRMAPVNTSSYAAIKRSLFLHAGITAEGKVQAMMFKPPPLNQTAVDTL